MNSIVMLGALAAFAVVGALAAETGSSPVLAQASVERRLGFDYESPAEWARDWRGGPPDTVRFEAAIVHAGRGAMVIERTATTPAEFSNAAIMLPVKFSGQKVELHGFLKTEQVAGRAGLWLRADGAEGMLDLNNMAARPLAGTNDWREFSVSIPLSSGAQRLVFGALLEGTGRLWVDDLRLLVDGQPVWMAPRVERQLTVLDRDHEFDAGSTIEVTALRASQVENLVRLGEVWGFLKYHHPRVTGGEVHWDYELFRVMPAVLAAGDATAANAALGAWIDRLGPLAAPGVTPTEAEGEIHLKEDAQWLADEVRWGAPLSAQLRAVFANRARTDMQFYVSLHPQIGNPIFSAERAYPTVSSTDDGYRLLALFRYWNIIRYWFPYRDLIAEDWRAVLTEFVPRLAGAREADDYAREMMRLIARVHDTHANLWSSLKVQPPVGEATWPIRLRFVEGHLVVVETDASDAAKGIEVNLKVGDRVLALDGRPVEELVAEWAPLYAASNDWTRRRDIARHFGGGSIGVAKVRVRRGDEEIDLIQLRSAGKDTQVTKRTSHDLPGPAFRLLSPEVAYLKLSAAKTEDLDGYVDEAKDTRGIVVDLRGYPKAFAPFVLGGRLVEQRTPFARFTFAVPVHPGRFRFGSPVEIVPRVPRYAGRVVVLIDEQSQSSSEYQAMALRAAPGAKVIGSSTAGADGNISRIPLPGGLHTTISGIGVFYPDKRPTQRVGIVPDIEVKPTVAGIHAGRDEVLEAALREILGAEVSEEAIRALVPTK